MKSPFRGHGLMCNETTSLSLEQQLMAALTSCELNRQIEESTLSEERKENLRTLTNVENFFLPKNI
jgi:hypothetical protein